jgi:hypothetical protein
VTSAKNAITAGQAVPAAGAAGAAAQSTGFITRIGSGTGAPIAAGVAGGVVLPTMAWNGGAFVPNVPLEPFLRTPVGGGVSSVGPLPRSGQFGPTPGSMMPNSNYYYPYYSRPGMQSPMMPMYYPGQAPFYRQF